MTAWTRLRNTLGASGHHPTEPCTQQAAPSGGASCTERMDAAAQKISNQSGTRLVALYGLLMVEKRRRYSSGP